MLTSGLTWGVPVTRQPPAYRVPGATNGTPRFSGAGDIRAELVQAPGPAGIGMTGAGTAADLHGTPWYLASTDRGLDLARQAGMSWVSTSDASALPILPPGARHLGLAFDQAARPVLAWDDGAQLSIRQWDASAQTYLNRGPFPGVDPVLLADLAVHGEVPESDVLVFYLGPGRDELRFRVQRENYLVEHVALTGLTGWVLDQINHFPLEAQLVGEDAAGTEVSVRVGPYRRAITGQDQGVAQATSPSGGALVRVVQLRAATDLTALASLAPSGGALQVVVLLRPGSDGAALGTLAPSGGALRLVVLPAQGLDPAAASALAPSGGALVITIITAAGGNTAAASAFAPTGGSLV